jgi:hypothetical protein
MRLTRVFYLTNIPEERDVEPEYEEEDDEEEDLPEDLRDEEFDLPERRFVFLRAAFCARRASICCSKSWAGVNDVSDVEDTDD